MSRPFMRQVVDSLLPKGAIWKPAADGDFDNLLDGVAENQQAVFNDLGSLEHIRDPYRCPAALLPDLEREFGIMPNNALTEKERRRSLAVVRYRQKILATAQKLQWALDMAGFGSGGYGLRVTPNSPTSDPTLIVDGAYAMTAHEFPSIFCAGNTTVAYCGYGGGYYLVAGDYYASRPIYPQAGEVCARAFDGSDPQSGRECCGYYEKEEVSNIEAEHRTPPEPYWPLVFFVGRAVTRNPDGRIVGVATVDIPAIRRQELHRLILRIKPMGVWAAMMVRYF